MANSNSNAFWWALIGFFVGVAATLGAMMWISGADIGSEGPEAPARSVALSTPAPAHRTTKAAPATQAAQDLNPASDEQVAEDAAAAGMTSRARAPSPEIQ